jgi:hypothetical protein
VRRGGAVAEKQSFAAILVTPKTDGRPVLDRIVRLQGEQVFGDMVDGEGNGGSRLILCRSAESCYKSLCASVRPTSLDRPATEDSG